MVPQRKVHIKIQERKMGKNQTGTVNEKPESPISSVLSRLYAFAKYLVASKKRNSEPASNEDL